MNELAVKQDALNVTSIDDMERLAKLLAASNYFKDARDAAQAFAKILAGKEMGFPSFASMTGIHIIQGKPAMGAHLIAAAIKRSGRYDYRVREHDDSICRIEFFENGESVGFSEFNATDAKKAGTQNMSKFPKNMLFARAISNGMRWFCPDLMLGAPIYTPEELGASVDEYGDVIDITPQLKPQPQTPPDAKAFWRKHAACVKEIGFATAEAKDEFTAFVSWLVGRSLPDVYAITPDDYSTLDKVFSNCENAKDNLMDWRKQSAVNNPLEELAAYSTACELLTEADVDSSQHERFILKITNRDSVDKVTNKDLSQVIEAAGLVTTKSATWRDYGLTLEAPIRDDEATANI